MDVRSLTYDALCGRDFYLCLGDFLDEFYRSNTEMREKMLRSKPDFSIENIHLAYLASAIHKLANDYNLDVPDWVFDEQCYLREKPFFGCSAVGNLRLLFMYKSPTEFKHRNLFVDENVLKRI